MMNKRRYYTYNTEYSGSRAIFIVKRERREEFIKQRGHEVKSLQPGVFFERLNAERSEWELDLSYAEELKQ